MDYNVIVGLEIHCELLTKTKMFCSCKNEFGNIANSNTCPICLGLPGSLPMLNKKVLEYAVIAGLSLNCQISKNTKMDRKNYFYPDLVKGYQISQFDKPLCFNGYIDIKKEDNTYKKIRIKRVHIEEDSGKSIYNEKGEMLLDFNRSGVPLIEIVTEPDISSSKEAYDFLEQLKEILLFTNISDLKMEEGSLRCDVNINVVREDGFKSNIVEIKNLNSFKNTFKAIEYEIIRHKDILDKSQNTIKETRRWDENKNKTMLMRNKETNEEYRYFPEPDIVNINISEEFIDNIKNNIPELINVKKQRFIDEFKLSEYDVKVLTSNKDVCEYFEIINNIVKRPKLICNWIMSDLLKRMNRDNISIDRLRFKATDFADFICCIESRKLNNNIAKIVFREMFESGKNPNDIIKEKSLFEIEDEKFLEDVIEKVLNTNKQSISDYISGKEKALKFLIGQVMKETKGRANAITIKDLILKCINDV